ncbi:cytochrome c-type biogenesis protein [Sulfitobacter sp. 20_GPM-1509m]|uniref:cytochrome c-type biogenesis protein n=1 Tax=Sulfitobacter sp. 20_GPM-1509m TaxID=1380367 RepID=UPI00048CE752|nr:cytochrome c-type biogenesis protein [Sulfitobacter sp. 20_GPM-1509m]
MKRLLMILLLLATPLWAVEPGEVLDNPALETRAREISQGLRCLVCRNESIDESHAPLARDLRLLVRERLVAGDTNAETVDFIVARYGEYVLLRPQATGANWLLWGAGPVMLLLALLGAGLYLRSRARSPAPQDQPLSAAEAKRLAEILDE